jgi:hypothetical protein
MSVTSDAPQQEEQRNFEAAADALFAQDAAPDTQDSPAEQQPSPSTPEAQAPTPAATTAIDDDADDESIDVQERIARAERRATKQSQAEIAAARKEAEDERRRVLSYQGNLEQAKRQREALEKERDEAKRLATDADSRDNARWEQLIRNEQDPTLRSQYEQMYADDKDKRTFAREKQAWEFQKQQEREAAEQQRSATNQMLETTIRSNAIGEVATAVDRAAADMGLPLAEIADIKAYLASDDVRLNTQHLSIPELHKYREMVLGRVDAALHQRAEAFRTRQAAQNRDEAKTVYRAEQPVGGGGGGGDTDLSRFHNTGNTRDMLDALDELALNGRA